MENQAGKSASRDITVSADGIYGIANIGSLQVDQPKDLLAGLTFASGIELLKVEIEQDGLRTEINDPHSFTPEYPGECSFIFTVKVKDGNTMEVRADNVTIKPLDYQEVVIKNADMISEKYPWYNNIQQTTKDFIYPHLIASYAACNWSKQDNRVHIIM